MSAPDPSAGLRRAVVPEDEARVRRLVHATGFFSPEEEDVAAELVREALERGAQASGYRFLFLEEEDRLLAYACFGPIPATRSSFDLYWIATQPAEQGRGHGRRLLAASEAEIRALGGTRVYVETSSRAQYEPTRAFYERCGYAQVARLEDFYAPGDGKVVYCRVV